ncbi:nucleotidyltransferase family protein [Portibacter marinus]|uniref:nucleotidyltransferase family protein n=1 Tax=Portibacter marinus TaxID=2898660 RepID=UPI001F363640|nr:nucleotidyltransferase domain-containing protein [Portibacter marinus]
MKIINENIDKITELCQQHNVSQLYVFGSILTPNFSSTSDIDLIVKIEGADPIQYTEDYFNLKYGLENLLKRSIDLLEDKSISNQTFKNYIDSQKIKLYDRQSESVA